ncbi:integrase arm-type DNA-binding domain-containing protein [Polynucleobacter sp. AP-Capit-er-40B-B4]|uniref:tyrosine-type recombinase/integrase n=1 Tax=Polynucleobacter sp. AP-Capit-er-40B-B4 TaxID=2576927 RepID=UPI001C0DA0D9|nr:site-specific integrase [Polynucleobacter sp. AP-Capit-er-40B-B4]MBU3582026.1 integrase arm-type DNA-binding domain-containing protein [Polynucleobacter sp. AP-Capit-er-40B-B4]
MATCFTDLFIKNLINPGRYTDGEVRGLNLQVKANHQKYWVFRYSYKNKRYDYSLGSYPAIPLKEARKRAVAARNQVNQGLNPADERKVARACNRESEKIVTFKDYALECIESKRSEWSNAKHAEQWRNTLRDYAFVHIGHLPINALNTEDILKILNPIWQTKTNTASRLRGRIEWILASATSRGLRVGMNPAQWRGHLDTILPKPSKVAPIEHHKALPYKELPSFINEIKAIDCLSSLALEFLILNANRTGEVLYGLREEIQGDIWTIPATRMKSKKEHRVPLCKRSLEILSIAWHSDRDSPYLFSRNGKHLSNMALTVMLRRMGKDFTVHGFRSTFRDWVAEETQHSPEVAEKVLAHTIQNKTESAYRRGDLIEPRRRLLTDWESYCQTGCWGNTLTLEWQKAA